MKRYLVTLSLITLGTLFLVSCSSEATTNKKIPGRWYTQWQVDKGEKVFEKNCVSCHGQQAQGITADWKKTLPDGSYPPPPLNGSAHAWHHPFTMLKRTINKGGIPLGGKMPPFKDVLKEDEKENVIAYFQSFWSERIYQAWLQRGGLK